MWIRARTATALLVLGLFASACGEAESESVLSLESLPVADVELQTDGDTVRLTAEIASSETSRAYGLMDRDHLDADAGMLFLYTEDRPPESAFYMYRTRIPLDIAFADSSGSIVSVLTMEPCTYPVPGFCPKYSPGETYRFALETNAGYFEAQGVGPGDRVVWRER